MHRLKPILVFFLGFIIGSLISFSIPGQLFWLPVYGTAGGIFTLIIYQAGSLGRGLCFVIFIICCFIIYNTQKKITLVKDPETAPVHLQKIYTSPMFYKKQTILMHLAENPNTPLPILLELSKSQDETILSYLAANVKASEETLALALIQSSYLKCEGLRKFILNENQVIQQAASHQILQRNCSP